MVAQDNLCPSLTREDGTKVETSPGGAILRRLRPVVKVFGIPAGQYDSWRKRVTCQIDRLPEWLRMPDS
jgi:hypothetical protein